MYRYQTEKFLKKKQTMNETIHVHCIKNIKVFVELAAQIVYYAKLFYDYIARCVWGAKSIDVFD